MGGFRRSCGRLTACCCLRRDVVVTAMVGGTCAAACSQQVSQSSRRLVPGVRRLAGRPQRCGCGGSSGAGRCQVRAVTCHHLPPRWSLAGGRQFCCCSCSARDSISSMLEICVTAAHFVRCCCKLKEKEPMFTLQLMAAWQPKTKHGTRRAAAPIWRSRAPRSRWSLAAPQARRQSRVRRRRKFRPPARRLPTPCRE